MTYIVVSANEIVKAEMERPEDPFGYYSLRSDDGQDHNKLWVDFETHCLSLPRIPIEGKHKWEVWQEVVEGKDFRFGQTDCKLGREGCICFPYLEKWCSDAIYIAIPIQPTPDCNHEPLVDTGIGYYHCPACKQGWTYEEWRSKQPTPEGEKVDGYYPGYQYQRLFNAIHSTGGTALQGEMDEIIRIVHKDFPLTNDNTQTK